jgi:hypothetical protein
MFERENDAREESRNRYLPRGLVVDGDVSYVVDRRMWRGSRVPSGRCGAGEEPTEEPVSLAGVQVAGQAVYAHVVAFGRPERPSEEFTTGAAIASPDSPPTPPPSPRLSPTFCLKKARILISPPQAGQRRGRMPRGLDSNYHTVVL